MTYANYSFHLILGNYQETIRNSSFNQTLNKPTGHDPMVGSSRSAMADFTYTRSDSFASNFSTADSDVSLNNGFRNLFYSTVDG